MIRPALPFTLFFMVMKKDKRKILMQTINATTKYNTGLIFRNIIYLIFVNANFHSNILHLATNPIQ